MVPKMGGDCKDCPNNTAYYRLFLSAPRPGIIARDDEIKALSDFLDKKIAEIRERQESKWQEIK